MSHPTSSHPRPCRFAGALLAGLLSSGTSVAQEVWVITRSGNPLQGTHASMRVIELDAAQRIEAELAAGLPSYPRQAEPIVRRRLQEGGSALQQRMRTAYQGITDAWSLGITTIPAVVVDQRYVVYGETDLDRALARIARYRKEHP
jgi:integrating conjugative element protein (TIGR03757 family)